MMRFIDPLFDSQHLVFNFIVVLHEQLPRADPGPWSLHASSANPYELFTSMRCPSRELPSCLPFSWQFSEVDQ